MFVTGVLAGGLSGAALGVLWWSLAPRVSVVVTPDRVVPEGFQPQEYFSANISFGALGRDRWRLGRYWVGIHAQGTLARILDRGNDLGCGWNLGNVVGGLTPWIR